MKAQFVNVTPVQEDFLVTVKKFQSTLLFIVIGKTCFLLESGCIKFMSPSRFVLHTAASVLASVQAL
jgi:hypothetical protein